MFDRLAGALLMVVDEPLVVIDELLVTVNDCLGGRGKTIR